ncbi:MAG: hypothetical protein H0U74_01765 [Bradymonadaceae bacterium]|nr:hypothetical protein [Lujinxingiaceae bacterium]
MSRTRTLIIALSLAMLVFVLASPVSAKTRIDVQPVNSVVLAQLWTSTAAAEIAFHMEMTLSYLHDLLAELNAQDFGYDVAYDDYEEYDEDYDGPGC